MRSPVCELLWLVALFAMASPSVFGPTINLLYKERVNLSTLSDPLTGLRWSDLSEERRETVYRETPAGFAGHVSILFPRPVDGGRVWGWCFVDMDDLPDDHPARWLEGFQIIQWLGDFRGQGVHRTLPGRFYRDDAWLEEGLAEGKIHSVSFQATEAELEGVVQTIRELSSGRYRYQLFPSRVNGEWRFPPGHFNCVSAAREALKSVPAAQEMPSSGSISMLAQWARSRESAQPDCFYAWKRVAAPPPVLGVTN